MSSRRNTELMLLIAAAFPVTLLYALYVVTTGTALTFGTLAVPLGLFAGFAAAHIGVRILAPGADPALLPVVFALSGVGITFVTRLNPDAALNQVVFLFVGIALMVGTLAVVKNLDIVKRYKYTLGLAGIILLILPIFIGVDRWGSKLWIQIGSFTIQPGEFAKVFIVLFLAGYLAENRELLSIANHNILGFKLPRLRLFAPLFVVWGRVPGYRGLRARPGKRPFVLHALPHHALCGHWPHILRCYWHRPACDRRLWRLPGDGPCANAFPDLA